MGLDTVLSNITGTMGDLVRTEALTQQVCLGLTHLTSARVCQRSWPMEPHCDEGTKTYQTDSKEKRGWGRGDPDMVSSWLEEHGASPETCLHLVGWPGAGATQVCAC